MDIKEYLRSVRKLKFDIVALQDLQDKLYSKAVSSGTPQRDAEVQTSISGDRLGDIVAEAADLDRTIERRKADLFRQQARAIEIIENLSKPAYRALMTRYYIEGLKWVEVAERLGYEPKYIERLHGKALNELREKGY